MVKLEAIKMKYGKESVDVNVNSGRFLGLLQSKGLEAGKPEVSVIKEALAKPIGSQRLGELVRKGETVCIVISDTTRAWQRMDVYLPCIVKELREAGIEDDAVTFLCATGSHRPQSVEELKTLLGDELACRFRVIQHNCRDGENLTKLGATSFGTPVAVNKTALECDHLVLTGAIVFHDLAGWGGGKKSILPGISSYESIMANHALSLSPQKGEGTNPLVRCGNFNNNPVHLDMLEAAAFVKPDFLFNVIIDENGKIGKAVAGNYIKAHEAGCIMVDKSDSAYIAEKADVVVTSAGGFPKDIDLYQASKALINAKEAVKKDGVIIMLAECMEGYGGKEVQLMIEGFSDNYSREKALREAYTIAGYTGYLIAEIAESYNVILVSSMDPEPLKKANIRSVSNVQEAVDIARELKGDDMTVYFMLNGASTLPRHLEIGRMC